MQQKQATCCPVCGAGFRRAVTCSRCGADLTPLMVLISRAWRLRTRARRALSRGHIARALQIAQESQRLHATDTGRDLIRAAASWG